MNFKILTLPLILITSSAIAQRADPPPVGGHSVPSTNGASRQGMGMPQYQLPADLFRTPANPIGSHGTAQRSAMLPNEGTVLSAQQSGGYSYIEVSSAQGNTWLAAPIVPLNVGDKIRYENGAIMHNFSSKALGRTFPAIMFVSSVSPSSKDVAPTSATAPQLTEGVVISSQDAGGYSYVEVKTAAGNTWLAGPATPLKAGDTVQYEVGAVMSNFSSRALSRTFPTIIFVDRVNLVPAR